MPKIKSEYLEYSCIKSRLEALDFICCEKTDYDTMHTIKIILANKKVIAIPMYCREYNNKTAWKALAFSVMIAQIERQKLDKKQKATLTNITTTIYKDCYVLAS